MKGATPLVRLNEHADGNRNGRSVGTLRMEYEKWRPIDQRKADGSRNFGAAYRNEHLCFFLHLDRSGSLFFSGTGYGNFFTQGAGMASVECFLNGHAQGA